MHISDARDLTVAVPEQCEQSDLCWPTKLFTVVAGLFLVILAIYYDYVWGQEWFRLSKLAKKGIKDSQPLHDDGKIFIEDTETETPPSKETRVRPPRPDRIFITSDRFGTGVCAGSRSRRLGVYMPLVSYRSPLYRIAETETCFSDYRRK